MCLTGGDQYLWTRERDFTWWQLAQLDLYAAVAVGLGMVLVALAGLLWGTYRVAAKVFSTVSGKQKQS